MTDKKDNHNHCECCGKVIDEDRDICEECVNRQLE